jgi:site-specific recombinase XerD
MYFTNAIFQFEKEMVLLGKSKNTIDNYKSSVKIFLEYFNEYPERINRQQIKDYLYKQSIEHSSVLVIQNIE